METKEQSKIQKLMKSKPAKAGVSVALVGTLALAGIGAYFTGTDTVENKFDILRNLPISRCWWCRNPCRPRARTAPTSRWRRPGPR